MKKAKQNHATALAQEFKALYEAFLMAGFSTDQAFELLLAVIKKEKV
jgi:hypothetical protein